MNYTVVWTPASLDRLAELWIDNPLQRDAIRTAGDKLDEVLRHNPDQIGEHRFDTVRAVKIPPLTVDFEINPDDRMVMVLGVTLQRSPDLN